MGYNDAARAMIRRARRQCDVCRYGPWSRTWTKESLKFGKNIDQKRITYFRSRTCQICGLKDVQTDYKSAYRLKTGDTSWKAGSISDSKAAFSESYYEE